MLQICVFPDSAFLNPPGNLVFQSPYERIIVGNQYCDVPLGTIYMIRGENIVVMGRIVSYLGFVLALLIPELNCV